MEHREKKSLLGDPNNHQRGSKFWSENEYGYVWKRGQKKIQKEEEDQLWYLKIQYVSDDGKPPLMLFIKASEGRCYRDGSPLKVWAYSVLAEDLSWFSRTYIERFTTVYTLSSKESDALSIFLRHLHKYMHRFPLHTYSYIKRKKYLKITNLSESTIKNYL